MPAFCALPPDLTPVERTRLDGACAAPFVPQVQ
jgi:hypothetical protein